jgi:chemotaxis protein CheD
MNTGVAVELSQQMQDERIVVGIGEYAVSDSPDATLVTHALGSCIAVCVWDHEARVGGLLHFLLPEAKLNPERAKRQPGTFADTGIPLLFQTAYKHGAAKSRCRVKLLGGASMTVGGTTDVGRRNLLAAKKMLWQNGVMVHGEAVGGHEVRTVTLSVGDGRVLVSCGREVTQEL